MEPVYGHLSAAVAQVGRSTGRDDRCYRYVRRDHSQCAARVADLRATLGDGHLEPLDIVAAYYIADNTWRVVRLLDPGARERAAGPLALGTADPRLSPG